MSLARLAMRLAAARTLRGATLAGDRVFDSAVDPIDQKIAAERQPILIVYTDDHAIEVNTKDFAHGMASCALVIEAAIASRVEMPIVDGEGEESVIVMPHTDEGMELVLDMMEHQAIAALMRGRSQWAKVWGGLVPKVTRRQSRRGASTEGGTRFAARQITLTCDLIEPPSNGAEIEDGSSWALLLAAMEADLNLAPIAGMLRKEIEGDPLVDWRRAAATLGVSLETSDALGLGPIMGIVGDVDPAELDEATLG